MSFMNGHGGGDNRRSFMEHENANDGRRPSTSGSRSRDRQMFEMERRLVYLEKRMGIMERFVEIKFCETFRSFTIRTNRDFDGDGDSDGSNGGDYGYHRRRESSSRDSYQRQPRKRRRSFDNRSLNLFIDDDTAMQGAGSGRQRGFITGQNQGRSSQPPVLLPQTRTVPMPMASDNSSSFRSEHVNDGQGTGRMVSPRVLIPDVVLHEEEEEVNDSRDNSDVGNTAANDRNAPLPLPLNREGNNDNVDEMVVMKSGREPERIRTESHDTNFSNGGIEMEMDEHNAPVQSRNFSLELNKLPFNLNLGTGSGAEPVQGSSSGAQATGTGRFPFQEDEVNLDETLNVDPLATSQSDSESDGQGESETADEEDGTKNNYGEDSDEENEDDREESNEKNKRTRAQLKGAGNRNNLVGNGVNQQNESASRNNRRGKKKKTACWTQKKYAICTKCGKKVTKKHIRRHMRTILCQNPELAKATKDIKGLKLNVKKESGQCGVPWGLQKCNCPRCGKEMLKKSLSRHLRGIGCIPPNVTTTASQQSTNTRARPRFEAIKVMSQPTTSKPLDGLNNRIRRVPCPRCGKVMIQKSLGRHLKLVCQPEEPQPSTSSSAAATGSRKAFLGLKKEQIFSVNQNVVMEDGESYDEDWQEPNEQNTEPIGYNANGEKDCIFEDCGFMPDSDEQLQEHLKIHPVDAGHTCPECGVRYFEKLNLEDHRNLHRMIPVPNGSGISDASTSTSIVSAALSQEDPVAGASRNASYGLRGTRESREEMMGRVVKKVC